MGSRLLVQPPDYLGLTAVVRVSPRPGFDTEGLRVTVLQALYRLFDPLVGGPDGTGWPFGRPVHSHEVHAALARIPGVDMARKVEVHLLTHNAGTGAEEEVDRMDLPDTALVFSLDHQVKIVP